MREEKKEIYQNCIYFDMTQQERESAIRYMLGAIIKCRQNSAFPSNCYIFDEDVNVYLAHLLFAVALPEYHEMTRPYLSMETSDIMNWVQSTDDRAIRYFIFKANADHILIHSGIFNDLRTRGPQKKILRQTPKHFCELARAYYEQAAAHHKRIYRKQTGVGDVLLKLGRYFENYQGLLRVVRREYFGFLDGFREQAFESFKQQIHNYEHQGEAKNLMDQFLDLYGAWLETKDIALEARIRQLAQEIKRLDPSASIDCDRLFHTPPSADQKKCA